jgi:hypothetical protein
MPKLLPEPSEQLLDHITFWSLSLFNTPTIPNVPKTILHIIEPLSILPYGSGILQTSPRLLSSE